MTSTGDWLQGRLVQGHGVASGRSSNTPYPAGTIAMQRALFASHGLDLADCWPGTINVCFAPSHVQMRDPDHCIHNLTWTDLHSPETFSFWRVRVRWRPDSSSNVDREQEEVSGWIYWPHPETKQRHWQPPTQLELLAPRIDGLHPDCIVEIRDSCDRIRLVNVVRLRARLLEFLKFRVLASQQQFFVQTSSDQRRDWLSKMHPEALALDDADLDAVWAQAELLYTEGT